MWVWKDASNVIEIEAPWKLLQQFLSLASIHLSHRSESSKLYDS